MDEGIRKVASTAQRDCASASAYRRDIRTDRARGSCVILDTNALSAFVDGDAAVGDILRGQARAAIPVIVLGEFRYGIAESRHRAAYEAWLDSQLLDFDI